MQAHRIIETWGKLYYKVSLQALVWLIFGINFARRHSANDILLVLIPPYVKFLTLFLFCTLVLTISSISFYTFLIHIFILLVIPQKYLDERFRQSSIAVTDVYIASFCVMTQDWMTVDKICWIWDLRGVLNHKFHRVDDATLLKTLLSEKGVFLHSRFLHLANQPRWAIKFNDRRQPYVHGPE